MTTVVGAIGVDVARFAALVAMGNNLSVYTFAKPLGENKVSYDKC